jgi:hypothetical protein
MKPKLQYKATGGFDTEVKVFAVDNLVKSREPYHYVVTIESAIMRDGLKPRFALFFTARDAWEMFMSVVQGFGLKIEEVET